MEIRGHYLIEEYLTAENSGLVARVRPQEGPDETRLLLKALPEKPTPEWQQSIDLLANTRCPHLRVPSEIGHDDQGHFLVARWLEGPSLEEVRQKRFEGKVPVRQALIWLRHLLLGLEVLHYHGLLHGDVKPSNLILDKEEQAVLVDLDCLHPLGERRPHTGTPEYLTPVETDQGTVQRDLFAAALTFAALVTGTLVPLQPEEPYRLSHHDPLIPEAADPLLVRCQSKNDKFESAGEMLEAVDKLLGKSSAATPTSTTSPPTRRVTLPEKERHTLLIPILLALLCYPAGYLAALAWKPAPVGAPLSVAQLSGVNYTESAYKDKTIWQTTVLGRPIAAFAGSDPASGGETAKQRAHWAMAVLQEAYFQDRALEFEFREELTNNCEVWLVGVPNEKFLMRVGEAESELFDLPAPALARLWTGLIQDTFTLLGFPARPGKPQGVLLLRPWRNRAETIAGGKKPRQEEQVRVYREALASLKSDQRETILESYAPEETTEKSE